MHSNISQKIFTPAVRKRTSLFLLVFVVMVTVVSLSSLHAADATFEVEEKNFKSSLSYYVYIMYEELYSGNFIAQGIGDKLFLSFSDPDSKLKVVWDFLQDGVYKIAMTVGELLIVLYFMIEMIERSTADNFTIEHFVKMLIKVFVAFAIIVNFEMLMDLILKASSSFMVDAGNINVANSEALAEKADELAQAGVIKAMGAMLQMILPYILVFFSKIVVSAVAYGRLLEFAVRTALAPLALANMFSGGFNSPGSRYIRKLTAVALQGAVITLILHGMVLVMGTAGANVIAIVALFLIAASLVVKSQSIANDLVGV